MQQLEQRNRNGYGLPAGVTAAFASNTITISGTPTVSGTFNYSIPLTGGCGAECNRNDYSNTQQHPHSKHLYNHIVPYVTGSVLLRIYRQEIDNLTQVHNR
jgi:hypothetical protein